MLFIFLLAHQPAAV